MRKQSTIAVLMFASIAAMMVANPGMPSKKKDKKADKETADSRAAQRRYRKLKQSGTAHTWQQLISQKKLLELDFNTIHGRALSLLVGSKF